LPADAVTTVRYVAKYLLHAARLSAIDDIRVGSNAAVITRS
jgi:hypothetical protein